MTNDNKSNYRREMTMDLLDIDAQTCDWGDCDAEAIATRWDAELGQWLPVCKDHTFHV